MRVSFWDRMFSCSRHGDLEGLKALLKENPEEFAKNINKQHTGSQKKTCLAVAAKGLRASHVLDFLLSQPGCDPLIADSGGFAPVHLCAVEGLDGKAMECFHRHDPSLLNVPTKIAPHSRPVYLATMNGNMRQLRSLLALNADADSLDCNGCSAMMAAAMRNDRDAIQRLTLADGNVDCVAHNVNGEHGWTALHIAAHYGTLDAARELLAQGAMLNAKTAKTKMTPLDVAREAKQHAMMNLLENPPPLPTLPTWRPSVHMRYPKSFRKNTFGLLLLMTRLRHKYDGPLWQMPLDLVRRMVYFLAESFRNDRNIKPDSI